jgi:hypothetical protein
VKSHWTICLCSAYARGGPVSSHTFHQKLSRSRTGQFVYAVHMLEEVLSLCIRFIRSCREVALDNLSMQCICERPCDTRADGSTQVTVCRHSIHRNTAYSSLQDNSTINLTRKLPANCTIFTVVVGKWPDIMRDKCVFIPHQYLRHTATCFPSYEIYFILNCEHFPL